MFESAVHRVHASGLQFPVSPMSCKFNSRDLIFLCSVFTVGVVETTHMSQMVECLNLKVLHSHEMTCINTTTLQKSSL